MRQIYNPRDPYPSHTDHRCDRPGEHEHERPQRDSQKGILVLSCAVFVICIITTAHVRYFALMQCLLNTYLIRAPSSINPLPPPLGGTPRAYCTSKPFDLDISYPELGKYIDQIRVQFPASTCRSGVAFCGACLQYVFVNGPLRNSSRPV